MSMVIRELDETTVGSTREILTDRFCPQAYDLVRKLLSNPVRKPGEDIGVVMSDEAGVAGVTASIVRRLYLGKEPFVGINGGLLATRKGASPMLLFALLKRSHLPRFGSVLFYSNTCSPATVKVKPCVGVRNHGPSTWSSVRAARLRRLPLLHRTLDPVACSQSRRCFATDRAKGLTASARPDFAWADDFFARYLRDNEGVVGSRTTAELTWAFGEEVRSGRGMVLAAEGTDGVVGYVVACPCFYDPSRWLVCDAIALRNDPGVLRLLFASAKKAVRQCSSARRLAVIGFPPSIAEMLSEEFPDSCETPCNGFMWGFSDVSFGERCEALLKGEKGWFFGPYDGDYCLCPQ